MNPETSFDTENTERSPENSLFGSPFFGWLKASVDAADPQVFRFSPRFWNNPLQAN